MYNVKTYLGSVVLAALLFQGCGSEDSTTDTAPQTSLQEKTFNLSSEVLSSVVDTNSELATQVQTDLSIKIAALYESNAEVRKFVDDLMAQYPDDLDTKKKVFDTIAVAITSDTTTQTGISSRGLLSSITDPITNTVKDALVDVLDTDVGNAVTGAAFDVVLNSDGVTVVMLDAARKSHTTSQIMVDSLEANWELTYKMCPMLRENKEFGEKFTALAEEEEVVGRFFFERIDSVMYNCLADAMLLSNRESEKGDYSNPVKHSTNGYMALLMERYATDYFVMPTDSTEPRRNDKFVSLLLNTGEVVTYDRDTKTFTGHGDGNELINEKFFYSLFKTPTSTMSFVNAMDKIPETTRVMLMDNIFLGVNPTTGTTDTTQGYLNIISIGSAMYDGIYGEKNVDGVRANGYGFGAYVESFIGFAGLIPTNKYVPYGKAFVNAGYEYALYHGIDVWTLAGDAAKTAWDSFGTSSTTDGNALAGVSTRSGGMGMLDSNWYENVKDLMAEAWSNVSLGDLYDALMNGDTSVYTALTDNASIAYHTFLDGRDANGTLAYPTEISNDLTVTNDTVYGFHGLVELAVKEDIFYVECGSRATNYYIGGYECANNPGYTLEDVNFTLPPFADITWEFAYSTAKEGVTAYVSDLNMTSLLADLSSNDLVKQYFYPDADNVYIPNWMLSIDWLELPDSVTRSTIATTDFNFNAGYFDIYVTSPNDHLLVSSETDSATIEFNNLTGVEVSRVDMGDDSIIAVDANGTTLDNLYVYKVRAITPEDTQAVIATLTGYVDSASALIGLDSSNASNVDTTDANATN